MGTLLKRYWLTNRKAIFSALIITFLLAVGFLAYLKFVGIPRTQARNWYNHAQLLITEGKTKEAYDVLQDAYSIWPEDYILQSSHELKPN